MYIPNSREVVSSSVCANLNHKSNFLSRMFETKVAPRRRWKTPLLTCHLNSRSLLTRSYAFICCGEPSRGYANERWQCYCVRNINGVITVPCRAIGPPLPRPSQLASFLSRPLGGEMSGVLWRAELIMAATDTGRSLDEPRGPEPQTAKRCRGLRRAPQQRWND